MAEIPKFQSEKEEAEFWDTHDSTEFLDELKPAHLDFSQCPKKPVSLRLSEKKIEALKKTASRRGIGYLTMMIRLWIAERLLREPHRKAA